MSYHLVMQIHVHYNEQYPGHAHNPLLVDSSPQIHFPSLQLNVNKWALRAMPLTKYGHDNIWSIMFPKIPCPFVYFQLQDWQM